jgi:hypothetical protein
MKNYDKILKKKHATETETKSDDESEKKIKKAKTKTKLKTKLKSNSDDTTNPEPKSKPKSDSDSDSDITTKQKPKKLLFEKNEKNENFSDILDLDFEYINSHIEKCKDLSKKNISDLVRKACGLTYCNRQYWQETENLYKIRVEKEERERRFALSTIEKIINMKYRLSEDDYRAILRNFNFTNVKFDFAKIFSKLKFDSFDLLANFIKCGYIADFYLQYINLEPYGKDKINENLSYIYTIREYTAGLDKLLKEKKIVITENYLKYARTGSFKKYILNNISKVVNDAKKIDVTDMDSELLKCTTIEEFDNFMSENNYKLSPQTIILACQQNLNFDLISHLITCKIIFDENKINELIQSYRDNENIPKLLMLIYSYGSVFSKSNYLEMLSSKYYASIFGENLGNNLIIDEQFVEHAYNSFVSHDLLNIENTWNGQQIKTNIESIGSFLENIEIYGEKDKKSAEGILALYCSVIFKLSCIVKKIKELKQRYNVNLNNMCLKYLYKNKNNILKDIIALFKKDNVIPDLESSKQYIMTIATPKFLESYSFLIN